MHKSGKSLYVSEELWIAQENSQNQLNEIIGPHRNWTDNQGGSLYVFNISNLHVCYSSVACSFCGTPKNGNRSCFWHFLLALLFILGHLSQTYYMGKCLVILQLDMPCFVEVHRRTILFRLKKEEECIWGVGTKRVGEVIWRKEGRKTVAKMQNEWMKIYIYIYTYTSIILVDFSFDQCEVPFPMSLDYFGLKPILLDIRRSTSAYFFGIICLGKYLSTPLL